MRLQSESAPDAADGHVAEAGGLGHGTGTPMGSAARGAFQGAHHHLLDLVVRDAARDSGSRLIIQAGPPLSHKPRAPLTYRRGGTRSRRATVLISVTAANRAFGHSHWRQKLGKEGSFDSKGVVSQVLGEDTSRAPENSSHYNQTFLSQGT
jgi:hypothetical protein